MKRRSFFAALASLPFVGRFVPESWSSVPPEEYEAAFRRHIDAHRRILLLENGWTSAGVGMEQAYHFPGGGKWRWRCGGCKESLPPTQEWFYKPDEHGEWAPKCLECALTGRVLPWPDVV